MFIQAQIWFSLQQKRIFIKIFCIYGNDEMHFQKVDFSFEGVIT